MKLNTQKLLGNTITLEEFSKDFTPEQNKIVDEEIKYYYLLKELKQLRTKLGYTQDELAQQASLPRTTVTKIESGTHNPTINTLMRLATAMGKDLQIKFV